jgi:hypothetical protein
MREVMPAGLSKTIPFIHKSVAGEYIVAIYYNGAWKENRMSGTLENAEATARDVHRRTGFVVQVRNVNDAVLAQYGFPNSESDCDGDWEEDEE